MFQQRLRLGWLTLALVACEGFEGSEGGGGGEGGEGGGGTGGGGGGSNVGTCSTSQWWSGEEGPTMQPGGDCVSCHASGEGPNFTVAGTVMNDYADSQGCYGVDGVTVKITDANGSLHELTTNATGNFYTTEKVPAPYDVVLEYFGTTRVMGASQVDGDCMSCHTASGAGGAPGRILAP